MQIKNFNFNNGYFNRSLILYVFSDLLIFCGKLFLESKHQWKVANLFSDTDASVMCFVVFMLATPTALAMAKSDEKDYFWIKPKKAYHPLPEIIYFLFLFYFSVYSTSFICSSL